MSALDESFPLYATALPAALNRASSNGVVINIYGYQQLEFLSHQSIRNRALEMVESYRKAGMDLPYPLPARSNEEITRWILVCQANFCEGTINEDTLRSYGAPNSLLNAEAERAGRVRATVPQLRSPYARTRSFRHMDSTVSERDSVIGDAVSRGLGHGKRHIEQDSHYRIGAEEEPASPVDRRRPSLAQDNFNGSMSPSQDWQKSFKRGQVKDAVLQDGLERGIGHGERHIDCDDHMWKMGEAASVDEGIATGRVGGEGRRHIPVATSMVNMGTADDRSGKRNESIPAFRHGMKHVDHFFTASEAEKGRHTTYTSSWRRDPHNLVGHMAV